MKNGRHTNYKDRPIDSFLPTNKLTCTEIVVQDRKEKKKFPRFAFLKISIAKKIAVHLRDKPAKKLQIPHTSAVIFLITIYCSFFNRVIGQEKKDTINYTQISSIIIYPKNAAYFELGGNGIYFSLNYERLIFQKKRIKLSIRTGITTNVNYFWYKEGVHFTMPIEINQFIGKRKNNFELGIGYLYPIGEKLLNFYDAYDRSAYFSLRTGYRYQGNKGLVFRAGFLFIVPAYDLFKVRYYWQTWYNALPWLGFSIGKGF